MNVTANMEGIPALLQKFKDLNNGSIRMAKAIIQSSADEIVNEAKLLAPKDLGQIAQNIFRESANNGYQSIITSNAPESPYQEFGTGAQVDIPAEMASTAAEFKGVSNGTFAEFLVALTGWIKRKGITAVYSVKTHKRSSVKNSEADADEQMAYVIARAILARGLKPQPFLYPAWLKVSSQLVRKLETALKQYLNEESK